jgi:Uma2 family endonuclease
MKLTTINIPDNLKVNQEQFEQLAIANRELRLERTATGQLIIMPPTGGNTGRKNIELEGQLWFWNRQNKLGIVFNSSTAFHLRSGADPLADLPSAVRSPDAAWVTLERWESLTSEQQDSFPPLCPDFAIELRSKTDSIETLREKMQEYLENGLRLGWLIDPKNRVVEIYRQSQAVEVLHSPASLSGEDVLPGFVLELAELWR